jgi:hypothetical protein
MVEIDEARKEREVERLLKGEVKKVSKRRQLVWNNAAGDGGEEVDAGGTLMHVGEEHVQRKWGEEEKEEGWARLREKRGGGQGTRRRLQGYIGEKIEAHTMELTLHSEKCAVLELRVLTEACARGCY